MDNTNSKIVTLSFLTFSAIVGFTLATLLKVFSGAFSVVARAMNYDLVRHGLPIAVAFGLFIYLQFNKGILKWADEVIAEVRKVVWPPAKDTRGMTIVVVIMVLISSVIVSVFDMFSGFVLNQLIK
ncbi:preprotein translocase subunit SecE [Pseudobdellovibrio exovorus]|uniref:Protein translocase subunit SecE n=1 Tax=Pseudobdellovibrio exovorus JSS TaxID=1184267 RepID=M4VSG2_9BACT|nr:preprotein translocase subunit SecE [Pseudobdellovibrio exovorus]AGH96139.1 preprotein translocase SecE subunit [Pseudobdellovibrio exovorus JSS]